MSSLHFITGLPRSGSTLLSALLRQNTRCHASVQTPLGDTILAAIRTLTTHESELFVTEEQRRAVVTGMFTSFYGHLSADRVIFDTNRLWCSQVELLAELLPSSRLICCVRNPAWIVDSFERQVRSHPTRSPRIFASDAGTVFARAEALSKHVLGQSLQGLKQAFYGEHARNLIVVKYDSLVANPGATLGAIYEFLGEPTFEHDFTRVSYDEPEFDLRLGMPGLHRVSGPVAPRPRDTILPPELFRQFDQEFWIADGNPRRVRIV